MKTGVSYSGFTYNDVQWVLDPNKKFGHMTDQELADSLGLIPTFIELEDEDVITAALNRYQFGGPSMKGGTVDSNGVYLFPEDPPLEPYATCMAGGKTIYVYAYGMISFVDIITKETVTYRFD